MHQKFFNTLWDFTEGKEDKDNFIQKALKACKVFKVKPLKTAKSDFHQGRQHTICFAKTYERSKKSRRVFVFLRQVQPYQRNGKKLRPVIRRWKSTGTFTKKRSDDMKRPYRDIKKIIWIKWRLLTSTKGTRPERPHSLKKHQSHPNQMSL